MINHKPHLSDRGPADNVTMETRLTGRTITQRVMTMMYSPATEKENTQFEI